MRVVVLVVVVVVVAIPTIAVGTVDAVVVKSKQREAYTRDLESNYRATASTTAILSRC